MLECLKPHKTMGLDEIGPSILKELTSTISPILTEIYRELYYATCKIPEGYRRANVVAVFKKGRKTEASNDITAKYCKVLQNTRAYNHQQHYVLCTKPQHTI